MLAIKIVLHPTDFSERSELAFRLACVVAREYGARLVLAHVIEPAAAVAVDGSLMPPPEVDQEALWARLRALRPNNPKVPVEHRLVEGAAAAEILRLAGETKADVIVMGTHGRRGLGRLLMGSVAEQVVRKAPCPVITVKAPLPQAKPREEAVPAASGQAADAKG
jgi:nucleotide-binding universal stress UspA family protein